jgi:ADP-heptose:LPS heptosyltransferase
VSPADLDVRIDCRRYQGSMPCEPHKEDGRRCAECSAYEAVGARVLLIKLGALGDVLRTTALLPSIRQHMPGAQITWITAPEALSILQDNSLIDRIVTLGGHHLEVLLTEHFDLTLSLDNEPLAASLGRLARCAVVRGFVVNDAGAVVPASAAARKWWRLGIDDGLKRQNRQTWFELMSELCEIPWLNASPQVVISPSAIEAAERHLSQWRGTSPHALIGLNTGGGSRWANKKWTLAGYVGFIREFHASGAKARVVLLGGPDERPLNRRIVADVGELAIDGGCHDDVHEFAALVRGLDVLVTSDSLGLHVATAVSTRFVALVGPTSPWELETFGIGEILTGDVECIACYRTHCDKPVTCMDRLRVSAVVEATRRQLREAQRATGCGREVTSIRHSRSLAP